MKDQMLDFRMYIKILVIGNFTQSINTVAVSVDDTSNNFEFQTLKYFFWVFMKLFSMKCN